MEDCRGTIGRTFSDPRFDSKRLARMKEKKPREKGLTKLFRKLTGRGGNGAKNSTFSKETTSFVFIGTVPRRNFLLDGVYGGDAARKPSIQTGEDYVDKEELKELLDDLAKYAETLPPSNCEDPDYVRPKKTHGGPSTNPAKLGKVSGAVSKSMPELFASSVVIEAEEIQRAVKFLACYESPEPADSGLLIGTPKERQLVEKLGKLET